MRRVIVNMHNYIFTNAISHALARDADSLDVREVNNPDEILEMCNLVVPHVLIMEVTSFSPYTIEERIDIRNKVVSKYDQCKMVFVCDERTNERVAKAVKQAKIDGLIDQFIYESISASYTVALIDAL